MTNESSQDVVVWFSVNAMRCIKNCLEFSTREATPSDVIKFSEFESRARQFAKRKKDKWKSFDLFRKRNGRFYFSGAGWLACVAENIAVLREIEGMSALVDTHERVQTTWREIGAIERREKLYSDMSDSDIQLAVKNKWKQLVLSID